CELLDGCGLLPAEVRDRAEQRRAGYEFVETHSLLRPSTCRGGPSAVATNERAVQAPGAAPGARAPGQAVRSASRPPRMSTDNLTERSGGSKREAVPVSARVCGHAHGESRSISRKRW